MAKRNYSSQSQKAKEILVSLQTQHYIEPEPIVLLNLQKNLLKSAQKSAKQKNGLKTNKEWL